MFRPDLPCRQLDFNSIKVQLELRPIVCNENRVILFQFHKGTIRTEDGCSFETLEKHFNSIKVQLEHGFRVPTSQTCPFQFHKGTIRTAKIIDKKKNDANFNSIKVQLELI